jgi:hypothetical protein
MSTRVLILICAYDSAVLEVGEDAAYESEQGISASFHSESDEHRRVSVDQFLRFDLSHADDLRGCTEWEALAVVCKPAVDKRNQWLTGSVHGVHREARRGARRYQSGAG